jgi:hypothetical protein
MGETGFEVFGPGGPVKFAVTNITISNLSTSPISVEMVVVNSCVESEITSNANVTEFAIPASSTLVVPFPTPWVTNNFHIASGPAYNTACIGFYDNGSLITVTGFSQ